MTASRTAKLFAIGTAGGLLSGLFGIGGGTIIVPLLILMLAYPEHAATGTSLLAIVVIATVAATFQAFYGNVHFLDGVLIGVPAVFGVLIGTALQQRVSGRGLNLLFSAFLVFVGVQLLTQ